VFCLGSVGSHPRLFVFGPSGTMVRVPACDQVLSTRAFGLDSKGAEEEGGNGAAVAARVDGEA